MVLPGSLSKPRPALVIQSNLFEAHPSVTVLPITSELREAPLFRVRVESSTANGLLRTSEIMVDKVYTVASTKIGGRIGMLEEEAVVAVNRALAVFLGFG